MVTKKLAPVLLALSLCGCASQYVMKLSNGNQILTASKPKLKGQSYHWKDARGNDMSVPQGKVVEIAPANTAKEEQNPTFKPQPPTKERHWYFLWLA